MLFLISWIFIGNYILYNLFLSILLDSFEATENDQDELHFEKNFPEIFKKYAIEEHIQSSNIKSIFIIRQEKL